MAYEAKAVANYFLELANIEGIPVSPMKLHKLLFFAHGWYLAIVGKPLLDEGIEAWKYGPIVDSIYQEFREFGNLPITTFAKNPNYKKQQTSEFPLVPEGKEHDQARQIVKGVWEVYKSYTALQLSSITHQDGTPWSTVAKKYPNGLPYHADIDNELIRNYFVHLATPARKTA